MITNERCCNFLVSKLHWKVETKKDRKKMMNNLGSPFFQSILLFGAWSVRGGSVIPESGAIFTLPQNAQQRKKEERRMGGWLGTQTTPHHKGALLD